VSDPRIALTTYSVKPRGGVVHTLELAEALQHEGADVTVIAMGEPGVEFFRPVEVPVRIVPAPPAGDTLEERVFSWIDAMAKSLHGMRNDFDIIHSQDCISARAAAQVRDDGSATPGWTRPFKLIRTVHHVDDFTTQALVDCQRLAIEQPDQVFVVSELWKKTLAADYGVQARVITNGVRIDRFAAGISDHRRGELRQRIGADDRFVFLTVGGIEPRKGSEFLVAALAKAKFEQQKLRPDNPPVMLAVIGGHSFQDYRQYRERVLGSLHDYGLVPDVDLVMLGTVDDTELPDWFHAADAFVFPSISEGWGLVVLEALAAGLPTITSDIDVFHEFLTDGQTAVTTKAGNVDSLAEGMQRLQSDQELVDRLRAEGVLLAAQYSWSRTAKQHLDVYLGSG